MKIGTADLLASMLQETDYVRLPPTEDSGSDSTTTDKMSETSAHIGQHHRLCSELEERSAALMTCMEALAVSKAPTQELAGFAKGGIHELASDLIETLVKKFSLPAAHSLEVIDAPAGINATAEPESVEPGHTNTCPVETHDSQLASFAPAPAFDRELLESFDGNKDEYGIWEAKTDIVMNAYEDPAWRAAVLTALPSKLKGDAASWLLVRWKDLQNRSGSQLAHPSWEDLRDDLRRHFRRPEEEAEGLADEWTWTLDSAKDESVTTYIISKLACYRAMDECPSEERLIAKLRAGMPSDLQNYVPTSIKNLDEMVDLLISQEPIWRRTSKSDDF